MTERLYYGNAYLKEFSALVLSCEKCENGFAVKLDKTAFFPEGGGQPGDTGFINGIKVLDTQESGEDVIHICEAEVPCMQVNSKIDFERRFRFMQQHSGEHIFSGILNRLTGFDNVGFHMGSEAVTVDFDGFVPAETIEKAEQLANETVWKNVPVKVMYPSRDELCNYNYRSKKEITGQVRLVEIEGADLCACCGTHVSFTGEVGVVKVISVMNYKQGVRITLQLGGAALEDYRAKNTSVSRISALLKAKPDEVAEAVEKLLEKQEETKGRVVALSRKLNSFIVSSAPQDAPKFAVCLEETQQAACVELCDALSEKAAVSAVFTDTDGGCRYYIVSHSADVRPIGKMLNEKFSGRGGGKPAMVQGSLGVKASEAKEFFDSFC